MLETASYTYIYGNRSVFTQADTYVARAPAGNLLGPWTYRTSSESSPWSPREADAVPVARLWDGAVAQYADNGYVMVGKDGNGGIYSDRIVAYTASTPHGPFTSPTKIYKAPEYDGTFTKPTYATHFHHHDINNKGILFSYSVWCNNPCRWQDATVYRPRFLRMLP